MPSDALSVVVLDNGAHTIKAGSSTSTDRNPRIIYNAAIRSKGDKQLYIGHEFEKCQDYASLSYRLSFERGYLTDWDVQKAVWDNLFGPEVFSLDFGATSLLVTEPPFNFHSIQEKYDQLVFEEYEFASYLRCPAASLAPYGSLFSPDDSPNLPYPECSLIVDSGFSFTYVIPLMQGSILWNGVRRMDIGGKLLTNHLSTLVSFRQWNMLDQTHIVNDVKEKCCYVSSSFPSDLERCRLGGGSNALEYVLPDFSRNRHGYVRGQSIPTVPSMLSLGREDPMELEQDANPMSGLGLSGEVTGTAGKDGSMSHGGLPPSDFDQILYMSNERFTVPELFFNPSDIGLEQSGLPHMIADSISCLPKDLQGMFWANVGLIGGNVKFEGFGRRLRQELRALAPVEYDVSVYESKEPIIQTYKSARTFANLDNYHSLTVTREEYNEGGSNACRRKFRDFDWDPIKDKISQASRSTRRERHDVKDREGSEAVGSADDVKKVAKAPLRKRQRAGSTRMKRDLPRG